MKVVPLLRLLLVVSGSVLERLARGLATLLGWVLAIPLGLLMPLLTPLLLMLVVVVPLIVLSLLWQMVIRYPIAVLGSLAVGVAIIMLGRQARHGKWRPRPTGAREVPLELVHDSPRWPGATPDPGRTHQLTLRVDLERR